MNTFDFKVGDRVAVHGSLNFKGGSFVEITAIGATHFLGITHGVSSYSDGAEYALTKDRDWRKVVEYPERWMNVYPGALGTNCRTREDADLNALGSRDDRIGVLHLRSDGTTEMLPA